MRPKILDRERAAILSSLGAGVVPSLGLHHIQVGRKAEMEAALGDLRRVQQGGAAVRFVVGRFGSGKSFFLNVIQTVALEQRFVVAKADITTERRLQGSGGQARLLYAELMKNLATRGKPEGGALASIVERWIGEVTEEVTAAGGSEADVERRVLERCKPLQDLVSGFDFAKVLAIYHRAFCEDNEALQGAALRWLRAEYTTKSEARQDLGVRTIIGDESFYEYLKLFAAFLRLAGHSGLMVCLDELVVLSHRLNNRVARDRNYEAILRIINDCLQGSVEGLAFVFAATDDCLKDRRRGLFSYEALATRLAPNRFAQEGVTDLAGPVIHLANLSPEDCYVLLHNVRRVHARGVDEGRLLPDEAIEAYLLDCNRRLGAAYFQTPRETIKDFIGLLNVLEQNPTAEWRQLLSQIKTEACEGDIDEVADEEEATPAISTTPETPGRNQPSKRDTRDDDLTSFKL